MQKSKIIFLAGLAMTFVALFYSCYYDEVLPEPVTIPTNQNISFSNDLIPIFQESCALSGCHVPGAQHPDLTPSAAYNSLISDNLINVQDPAASELYQWLIGNKEQPMPITGVDPQIAALVLAWIQQGAQNN
jgi:hypothetical protein